MSAHAEYMIKLHTVGANCNSPLYCRNFSLYYCNSYLNWVNSPLYYCNSPFRWCNFPLYSHNSPFRWCNFPLYSHNSPFHWYNSSLYCHNSLSYWWECIIGKPLALSIIGAYYKKRISIKEELVTYYLLSIFLKKQRDFFY